MRIIDLHFAESPSTRAMGAGRELFARRQDGSEVPVEVSLSPMKTPRGSFVLASIVDISVRRASEQAAARQRNELAHLSRVSMLGALSGSLAHELNQPLTAILSNAQAAQRFLAHTPPRLDQVNDIIADIVKNDRRAAMVIQRLRSLLKRDVSEHVPLEVNETVQDALRLMQSDLLSRGVDVVTDFARRSAAGQCRPRPASTGHSQLRRQRLRGYGRSGIETFACRSNAAG